jgi:hypothetical protein
MLIVYVLNKNGFIFYIKIFITNMAPPRIIIKGDRIPNCQWVVTIRTPISHYEMYHLNGDPNNILWWVEYLQRTADQWGINAQYALVQNDLYEPNQSSWITLNSKFKVEIVKVDSVVIEIRTLI